MRERKILGIETSCDDTSLAVISQNLQSGDVEVLAHERFDQNKVQSLFGGIVPELAAREHLQKLSPLFHEIVNLSGVHPRECDAFAVTTHPGLMGPLLTGMNLAKSLAMIYEKPILGINHLYAHLEAIHLTEKVDYPYLGLLVSGGHGAFFWVENERSFKLIGQTIDDAPGEAFDKGGKLMGLGYPAGHLIDRYSEKGNPKAFSFPIGLERDSTPRMSFSGTKTSLRSLLQEHPQWNFQKNPEDQVFYDLCASYQDAIVEALVLKTKRAMEASKASHAPLVIGGGVACNRALRRKMRENFPHVHIVAPKYCTDNGAMIAHYALRTFEDKTPFPDCLQIEGANRFLSKKEAITQSR